MNGNVGETKFASPSYWNLSTNNKLSCQPIDFTVFFGKNVEWGKKNRLQMEIYFLLQISIDPNKGGVHSYDESETTFPIIISNISSSITSDKKLIFISNLQMGLRG